MEKRDILISQEGGEILTVRWHHHGKRQSDHRRTCRSFRARFLPESIEKRGGSLDASQLNLRGSGGVDNRWRRTLKNPSMASSTLNFLSISACSGVRFPTRPVMTSCEECDEIEFVR